MTGARRATTASRGGCRIGRAAGGGRRRRRVSRSGCRGRGAGGARCRTATAIAEIGHIPARAFELKARRGQLFFEGIGTTRRALRQRVGRNFLQNVLGVAAGLAFVSVDGHVNNLRMGKRGEPGIINWGGDAYHKLTRTHNCMTSKPSTKPNPPYTMPCSKRLVRRCSCTSWASSWRRSLGRWRK